MLYRCPAVPETGSTRQRLLVSPGEAATDSKTWLEFFTLQADQMQTSPSNLLPAMRGTVWSIWQVISCWDQMLPSPSNL